MYVYTMRTYIKKPCCYTIPCTQLFEGIGLLSLCMKEKWSSISFISNQKSIKYALLTNKKCTMGIISSPIPVHWFWQIPFYCLTCAKYKLVKFRNVYIHTSTSTTTTWIKITCFRWPITGINVHCKQVMFYIAWCALSDRMSLALAKSKCGS